MWAADPRMDAGEEFLGGSAEVACLCGRLLQAPACRPGAPPLVLFPPRSMAAGTTNQVRKVRYGDVDDSNFKLPVPLILGLAAVVVAFVALCLYLCWLCCRRREASSSSAATASPVAPGLDADAINGLPVTLYSPARHAGEKGSSGEDGEREVAECSICISALVAGDKVKALPPCGHCFHPDCVDASLRSQPSCPLCRTLLLTAGAKPVDAVNGSEDESAV